MPLYLKASLRRIRKQANISRQQLASETSIRWHRLDVIESGRKAPTQEEIQAIVEALRRMGVRIETQAIPSLFGPEPELARQALRRQVREALVRLLPFISLRQLEALLDLSQGYLSRLLHCADAAQRGKSVVGTPSFTLVCTLVLLAQDPKARLQELRQFWDGILPPAPRGRADLPSE